MLTTDQLFSYHEIPDKEEISLELYREFSESVLMRRLFHYYFEDGTDLAVEFTEDSIRHMLAIQHIDARIPEDGFFEAVENGLSLSDFTANQSINRRYKKYKFRIRLFSCVYNAIRTARVFYLPTGKVPNTNNVRMDYLIYKTVDGKGFNIGVKKYDGNSNFEFRTILVAGVNNPKEHVDGDTIEKYVNRLLISNKADNTVIEDIRYADSFIMSNTAL